MVYISNVRLKVGGDVHFLCPSISKLRGGGEAVQIQREKAHEFNSLDSVAGTGVPLSEPL